MIEGTLIFEKHLFLFSQNPGIHLLSKCILWRVATICIHQQKQKTTTTTTILFFFYLNASTLNNTDTVRPGGGEKTLRSSRLPPPKYMLSKTLN